MASRFPSELGVHGTMRLPNRKEELAREKYTAVVRGPMLFVSQILGLLTSLLVKRLSGGNRL